MKKQRLLGAILSLCLVIPMVAVGSAPAVNAVEYTEQEIKATNTYESMTPITEATLQEENGVYSIASADDWATLVAKNSDFAGKTIVFTENLDLTGKSSLATLAGKLDGNGKTVTGLSAPLVATLADGAEVMNLTVENSTIVSAAEANTGAVAGAAAAATTVKVTNVAVKNVQISGLGATFAGIVGLHSGAGKLTLTNCTVSGAITSATTATEIWMAGMVAKAATAGSTVELYNCKNSASLTTTVAKNSYFGGMVGSGYIVTAEGCVNDGSITNATGGYHLRAAGMLGYAMKGAISFTDCVNNGDITDNRNNIHNNFVGGMLGQVQDNSTTVTLLRCKNTGDLMGSDAATNGKTGGMIAYNCGGDATLTDCVNEGKINGRWAAGGMVADTRRNITMTNCVNSGEVISCGTPGTADTGEAGGLVGFGNDSSKTVSFVNCANSGNVTGLYCAGGMFGFSKEITTNVTGSVNTGDITSTMHGAGGIVGFVRQIANIDGCVNMGNIYTNTDKTTGNVVAKGAEGSNNMSAGGILGWAYLTVDTPTTVKNCVNLGEVFAPTGAGGICGLINSTKVTSTIENCVSFGDITVGFNCAVIVGRCAGSIEIKNCAGDGVLDYQYDSGTNKGVIVGCKGNETYAGCTVTATIDGVKKLSVNGTETAAADNAALITALGITSVDTQVKADKTSAIFVAGINSLEGLSATGFEVFKINADGKLSNVLTKTSEKIYTGLNGYGENGEAAVVSASEYGVAYMSAMEIYNIPTDETVTYVLRPFTVAEDGVTVVYGATSYITFEAANA